MRSISLREYYHKVKITSCLLLCACSTETLPGGPNFTMRPDGAVVGTSAPNATVLIYPLGRNGTPGLELKAYALDYVEPDGTPRPELGVGETPLPRSVFVPSTGALNPEPVKVTLPVVSAAVVAYGKPLSCIVSLKGATDQQYQVRLTASFPIVFK